MTLLRQPMRADDEENVVIECCYLSIENVWWFTFFVKLDFKDVYNKSSGS